MAGVYIHIPLCTKRCSYCSFFSTTLLDRKAEIVDAICRELDDRREFFPDSDNVVSTLYIGGGTPSLLCADDIERLITHTLSIFPHTDDMEVTLEANPDDLTDEYVSALRDTHVNRLSIGVQSFDDEELRLINRRHNSQSAIEAIGRVRSAGFSNFGIDLIYGLPSQSVESFSSTLDTALSLSPTHISAYSLELDEGSLLFRRVERGELELPSDDDVEAMSELLCDRLERAGYDRYEISNWALDGFRSRHNSAYWDGTPYLGVGASAHSFDGVRREWNVSNVAKYLSGAEREGETLSPTDVYNEYLFLSLRTKEGISIKYVKERFGEHRLDILLRKADRYVSQRLLSHIGDSLVLTRKGIRLSNMIMSDLFEED